MAITISGAFRGNEFVGTVEKLRGVSAGGKEKKMAGAAASVGEINISCKALGRRPTCDFLPARTENSLARGGRCSASLDIRGAYAELPHVCRWKIFTGLPGKASVTIARGIC